MLSMTGGSAWAQTFTYEYLGQTLSYEAGSAAARVVSSQESVVGSITIPAIVSNDGNIYNVTSVGHGAFENCNNLTEIILPDGITSIGSRAFRNCSNLTKMVLPVGIRSIGSYAFQNCGNLTEMVLPAGLTTLEYNAFENCSGLTEVILPVGITSIDQYVFAGCTNLENVSFHTGITSIGGGAFRNCYNLTDVTLPAGLKSISSDAFRDCYSLTNIIFPSVLEGIGSSAFQNCSGLTDITIPRVGRIDNEAFRNCTNLKTITFRSAYVPKLAQYAFSGAPLDNIYVPLGFGSNYKNHADWSAYISKIKEILIVIAFINLDTQGGEPMNPLAVMPESTYPPAPPPPAKKGYTFTGWYDAPTGGSAVFFPVRAEKDTTLYAQWKAKTYTITFNARGGTISPNTHSATFDATVGSLPTPTHDGHTFNGWFTTVTGGTQYTDATVYTTDANITLYAQWTAIAAATVPVTAVSLKPSTALLVGATETLSANVSPSDATNKNVTWSSSDAGVASVDATGKITAISAGTATITVKTDDGNKIATCVVTVATATVPVMGVAMNVQQKTMSPSETFQLTATISPSNATNQTVTWASDNPSAASVDATGEVTAHAVGNAKITVTTTDGGKTTECNITVNAATVSVTGISLNKTTLALDIGASETFIATVTPSNATNKSIVWSADDASIILVENDKVTGLKNGVAMLIAKTQDGNFIVACQITVGSGTPPPPPATIPVTSVSLKSSTALVVGSTETLTATVNPSNATDKTVSWTSSDPAVVIIDVSGMLTALEVGSTTITVTTTDGAFTATCEVMVTQDDVSNDAIDGNSFRVYPNPTDGVITVTGLTIGQQVRIYTLAGTQVAIHIATASKMEIDFSTLPRGTYILKTITETVKVIRK